MNFYATTGYLDVVAEVCYPGRRTKIEDVRIGDEVLRLLVVDDKQVVTRGPFLDYHEPLQDSEVREPTRTFGYAEWVVRGVIERDEWDPAAFPGLVRAPFVDWSRFPTFESYKAYIRERNKGILKDQERRRARLTEHFGALEFTMNDEREDVFDLARRWKGEQLIATGVGDWFTLPTNIAYFEALRRKGLLVSSTLRAGGRLLSAWLGFVHDGVWSGWIFTFDRDPGLKKYSLGHQLLHSMLEHGHKLGHREFDFSAGDEDYKWLYATHARLLGPIGRAPLSLRVLSGAKQLTKKALAINTKLLEGARAMKKAT